MSEYDAAVDDEVHVKKRQQVKIHNREIQSESYDRAFVRLVKISSHRIR